ncbi:M23 family metallopeptidase [Kribbella sp. CA-293567]|uniref:M23 family metallopeptidase n=1 Tax=Kribbella sp. CA-293567 TaxID=3002436 RepID=UPI0022DD7A7F|nr:M23 family metallopeptidase [Kribbella sp. CA-293567]WBQ05635.1 M23 family metallopeptidase [Kribbella sp. CA-293567]
MKRSVWVIFLSAALVVSGGGLLVFTAVGGFDQPEPDRPQRPTVASSNRTATAGSATKYVFPVAGCRADASQSHHDYPASDIFAAKGCKFVSPVDGRVDEVTLVDTWDQKTNVGRDRGGLSVSVVGVDGVRYYGSHLSAVEVEPGRVVRAGQTLGLTGKTGSAQGTPPHLHFGISWPTVAGHWWIRRGAVPPQAFLNAWHDGRQLSPVATVAKAKRSYGVDRACRSYC